MSGCRPGTRAIWIPAGTVHAHRAYGAVDLHLVGLRVTDNPLGLRSPTVLAVGPLLRELIIHYTRAEDDGSPERARLRAVLLDQLRASRRQPLYLPAPTAPVLRALCLQAGRGYPGSLAGRDGQHSAGGMDELVVAVPVGVDRGARRHPLGAGRSRRIVADIRHHVTVHRKRVTVPGSDHDGMRRNTPIVLLSVGHACVDVYQGAVAALVPFFVAERAYTYAAAAGVVLAASLLSSVAQPVFGALTDRRAVPWLLPASTLLGGLGVALSGLSGSYPLTLVCVAVSGVGVAAYHPESARVARIATRGSHRGMGWFATGGNIGFAPAPLMVTSVVTAGGLCWTPLLVPPALAGAAMCLPAARALQRNEADGAGTTPAVGGDDTASFVKLSLAVAFRSITLVGLSTFISLYARQRLGGSAAAGTTALTVLYLGGAAGSLLGGVLAGRWDRVTVSRWSSYLVTTAAVAGVVWVPGPAIHLFVALTSVGLYVPFSLQVTLGQDYLPSRVGTAGGITLGLTVSIGGLAAPALGRLADATSLQTALTPLVLMPVLGWLLFRTLPEPKCPMPGLRARSGSRAAP